MDVAENTKILVWDDLNQIGQVITTCKNFRFKHAVVGARAFIYVFRTGKSMDAAMTLVTSAVPNTSPVGGMTSLLKLDSGETRQIIYEGVQPGQTVKVSHNETLLYGFNVVEVPIPN